MTHFAARNNAQALQARLEQGGRVGKRETLRLCADVLSLIAEVETLQRRPDYTGLYNAALRAMAGRQ